MTRIKAALSHLFVSSIVFTVIVFVLIVLWYPQPHFSASGGWQGLKIAACVDLILGPLLTFTVFNTDKSRKTIIGDLIVIAIIQFSALIWGVNTIYQQRPLAVVFWEDRFYTVPANELEDQGISKDFLTRFGQHYPDPVMIYAEKPRDTDELKAIAERTAKNRIPPYQQLDLYRPIQPYFGVIKSRQLDIEEIISNNAEMKTYLFKILEKEQSNIEDYVYIPLLSKYRNIILMFNLKGEWVNQIIVPLKDDCKMSVNK